MIRIILELLYIISLQNTVAILHIIFLKGNERVHAVAYCNVYLLQESLLSCASLP